MREFAAKFASNSQPKPYNFYDTYILLYVAQYVRAPFCVNLSGRVPLTPRPRRTRASARRRALRIDAFAARERTPSSRRARTRRPSSRARARDASSRAMANAGELLARADALLKKYVGAARLDAMRA